MARRSTFDFLVDELMDRVLDIVEPAMEDIADEMVDRVYNQLDGGIIPPFTKKKPGTGTGKKHFKKNPSYDHVKKQWPKTVPIKTLYEVLEVSPRASQDTIDAAWKSLCKRYHPDVDGGKNVERMKEINHAHEVLSDPVERKRYDRTVL